jgi:acetylornithine/succinyldiaminopimelate/putrescine aminotransferase
MVATKLVITSPLLGGNLSYGAEYINTHRNDDYEVNRTDLLTNSYSKLEEQTASPFIQYAHEVGEYLIAQLKELQKRNSHITEVRGRGLMVGAVLDIPHKEVRSKLIHEQHCFTGCAGTNILRILPPLVLTKENVDDFIEKLETVLKEV